MEKTQRYIPLYQTYMTDLSRIGATILLDGKPIASGFTKSFYKGSVFYKDMKPIPATFAKFRTGNIRVLGLLEDADKEELLSALSSYKEERLFRFFIRRFIFTLTPVASIGFSLLVLFGLFTHNFSLSICAALVVAACRAVFVFIRNKVS